MMLERDKTIKVLSSALQITDIVVLDEILASCHFCSHNTSDIVIEQGSLSKSLYILLSGRLRVVSEMHDGHHILGDVGEGDVIGEMAFFTNEARSATVYALRPSTLIQLNHNDYLRIIATYPSVSIQFTNLLVSRLKRNNERRHLFTPPRNILIIHLQEDQDISPWVEAVKQEFLRTGTHFNVYDSEVVKDGDYESFYRTIEESRGLNFFVCNDVDLNWSKKCLLYADLVIVASEFSASCQLYNIERELSLYDRSYLNIKTYLLLLHPEDAPLPRNTKRWFEDRKLDMHIHCRVNNQNDTSRFCRIVCNKAVGVVLGGGGTRGYAHVGAVKAMLEEGVQFDFLGGTSAGAIYGLAMAICDFDFNLIGRYLQDSVDRRLFTNEMNFPVISLMKGRKLVVFLKYLFKDYGIEDFWITTYCVSTNYSKATVAVHDKGYAWRCVKASTAIPGVFPPVIINGDLHIDGCVMDNLPIQPMLRYPVANIVALALSALNAPKVELEKTPSSTALIFDKVLRRNQYQLPGLVSLIIDSLTLNSLERQEHYKENAAIYIAFDLTKFGILDDKKWREVLNAGYDHMKQYINDMPPYGKFWIEG